LAAEIELTAGEAARTVGLHPGAVLVLTAELDEWGSVWLVMEAARRFLLLKRTMSRA
jgi:predicted protein tyrosine phosphatase